MRVFNNIFGVNFFWGLYHLLSQFPLLAFSVSCGGNTAVCKKEQLAECLLWIDGNPHLRNLNIIAIKNIATESSSYGYKYPFYYYYTSSAPIISRTDEYP